MTTEQAIHIARKTVSGLRRASGNKARGDAWRGRDRSEEMQAARALLAGTRYESLPQHEAGNVLRIAAARGGLSEAEDAGLTILAYQGV